MNVLVDTCVWSLALRRKLPAEEPVLFELQELIREFRVKIIGPIRQEILSGVNSNVQFRLLREKLSAFPDVLLETKVFERAAVFYNLNRKKGVQGSHTDFLICAVSDIYDFPILTIDNDFLLFRNNLPIKLHEPRF